LGLCFFTLGVGAINALPAALCRSGFSREQVRFAIKARPRCCLRSTWARSPDAPRSGTFGAEQKLRG
jgi:hypothetical protein